MNRKRKKTPLDLLEELIKQKLHLTPRYVDQEELLKMQAYWLCSAEPIANMITLSVSIPKWNKASIFGDCSVQVWAWEREAGNYISFFAALPSEFQGKTLQNKLSMLNNQTCFAGRFFIAENAQSYFYLSQAIFSRDRKVGRDGENDRRGKLVELAQARAARDQAEHSILFSLSAVIADMAKAVDMVAEACLPVSYFESMDLLDLDF
jgi:hypothetical protein